MKPLLALLFSVALLNTSQAQLAGQPPAIYFNKLKATSPDPAWSGKLLGVTIASPDWSKSIQILVLPNASALRFACRTNYGLLPYWQVGRDTKPVGTVAVLQSYYVTNGFNRSGIHTNIIATAYASGKVGAFTINGVQWQGAKTLTWESHNFVRTPQDIKGTLALDTKDTFALPPGSTVDTVAASLVEAYISGFYTQLPDPYQ